MSDCPYCGRPMPVRHSQSHNHNHNHERGPFRSADGKVFGVCAGIADHFGWSRTVVRLIALLGLVFFFPAVLIVYLLAALLMDREPVPVVDSSRF